VSRHVAISPEEAADRLAIRELVDAYAHCADRRDAKGQMALFTADTHFVVYMNAKDPKPSQDLNSREALAPVFADLNRYDATTHFVGQSTILTLNGNRATGEAYCLAHHVTMDGGRRRLMIASLRYLTLSQRSMERGFLPSGSSTSTGWRNGHCHERFAAKPSTSPPAQARCVDVIGTFEAERSAPAGEMVVMSIAAVSAIIQAANRGKHRGR